MQRALLPQLVPDVPGYEFYFYYESALEIGGDYYDFIPLPGQRLAILLGDVSGKGVAGALVMVKFSVEARACLLREPDLAVAIRNLNTIMNGAGLADIDMFVTLIAVVLDPRTHSVILVNAGHPSPLHFGPSRSTVAAAPASGPPIGIFNQPGYTCSHVQLQPGESLMLFSDGIPDAMDAQNLQFNLRGVKAHIEGHASTPRETGESLIEAVKKHASGCSQKDDMTQVCFGRSAGKTPAENTQ